MRRHGRDRRGGRRDDHLAVDEQRHVGGHLHYQEHHDRPPVDEQLQRYGRRAAACAAGGGRARLRQRRARAEQALLGHAPLFDGTDLWPVDPASLASPGDVTSALTQFPQGHLTADTWVGAPPADLVVQLVISGVSLPLAIGHATVVMTLDGTRTSATNGTIAGILSVTSLMEAFQQVAGTVDPSLCSSPTIMSITAQIAQAADILLDGTQDPTKPCDGISIGLGFDARVVQLGPIAPPTPPPPNPCGP